MNINLLDDALHALNRAAAVAAREGYEAVSPEHILAGVISESAPGFREMCDRLDLDPEQLADDLRDAPPTYEGHLPFTEASHRVLTIAVEHAQNGGHDGVTSSHLFLGLLRGGLPEVNRKLDGWAVDGDEVASAIDEAVAGATADGGEEPPSE